MTFELTPLKDCLVLQPKVFGDERGFFTESFNQKVFNNIVAGGFNFVQDNHSKSARGVLRGLHCQTNQVQGKLVRVSQGAVYDVVVDLRQSSPTFKKWHGVELTDKNFKQLWVPPGFAHGFLVLSKTAEVLYKTTDYYDPSSEVSLKFDDPTLGINWPLGILSFILSAKDQKGLSLDEVPVFE